MKKDNIDIIRNFRACLHREMLTGRRADRNRSCRIVKSVFSLAIMSSFCGIPAQTRVASFGSNPDFSYSLFPQDISGQRSNALIFFPSYRKSPWWGDIDEINNKPSGAIYTITGTEVFRSPAYFKESAKLHTSGNTFGYSYRPSQKYTARVDLDYTVNALRDRAEGNFTNRTNDSYIPFDYSLKHTLNSILLDGLFGFSLFGMPAGMKLSAGVEHTLALKSDLEFIKNDTIRVSTSRALWGWSTNGCSHIFGPQGTEGDAWLQNEYSTGPLYTIAFTGGATLEKIKMGMSLHYNFGRQDHFFWKADTGRTTGDTILDRNFLGYYAKDEWVKKSHDGHMDFYGNIRWLTGDMFDLNSFVRIGYRGNVAGNARADNLEVESDRKEAIRGFAIEADPNISIKLGEWLHYIDIALLLQYEYNRFNNTYLQWIGGGRTRTYWNSRIYELDETDWESFSYSNQNIFDAGLDLSAMFPLFDNNFGKLGLGFIMFGGVECNFQTKYYGTNDNSGSEVDFNVANRRENFTREVAFSTVLMLNYIVNQYNIRLETTSPLLHSQKTRTRITGADGKNAGPYRRKNPLWQSPQGLQVGLFISYDYQLPFLKYR